MKRAIVGFQRDAQGDWAADLECGHAQHTRHDPPLSERPWVLGEESRAQRVGTTLDCVRCDRRELPEGHVAYRRTRDFDASSVPAALRSRHGTKRGVWARIHVAEGRLRYRIHEPLDEETVLESGDVGVVLPGVEHEVEPLGPVRFHVEFYQRSKEADESRPTHSEPASPKGAQRGEAERRRAPARQAREAPEPER